MDPRVGLEITQELQFHRVQKMPNIVTISLPNALKRGAGCAREEGDLGLLVCGIGLCAHPLRWSGEEDGRKRGWVWWELFG